MPILNFLGYFIIHNKASKFFQFWKAKYIDKERIQTDEWSDDQYDCTGELNRAELIKDEVNDINLPPAG